MTTDMQLLIIDDDQDLLRQLEFLLEDDFASVRIAGSKNKALEMTAENTDVFLIDVRLSETDDTNTDGLVLAKELRQKSESAVIIMMSRYDARKFEELSHKEAHADGFIRKPFTMDEFLQMVREIKEGKRC